MKISNVVKGHVTQALMKTLLERAGYRVIRFGIEELFSQVVHLNHEKYAKLGLSPGLRMLPDLLVTDAKIEQAFLVEVKFRSIIDKDSLHALQRKLSEQAKHWPEMYTILLTSTPGRSEARYHQDYIRIVRPGQYDNLLPSQFLIDHARPENIGPKVWEQLPMLHEVFDKFHFNNERSFTDDADFIATTLKDLKALGTD